MACILHRLTLFSTFSTGEHDMRTTHNETYKKARNPQRAVQIVNQPTLKVSRTFGGFESETQNRRDFGEFRNGFPSKVQPIAPAPETIDLRFDNKYVYTSCVCLGLDLLTIKGIMDLILGGQSNNNTLF